MYRRLATAFLLLGVLTTLTVAVRHDHFAHHSNHQDGCIHCTGAVPIAPPAPKVAAPPPAALQEPRRIALTPARKSLLRPDYSGCAPPPA